MCRFTGIAIIISWVAMLFLVDDNKIKMARKLGEETEVKFGKGTPEKVKNEI